MGSNGKKKTTFAKLNREAKLREKRADKLAKKEARKRMPAGSADGTYDPYAVEYGPEPAPVAR